MPASQTETIGKIGTRSWSTPWLKDPTLPVWIGVTVFLVFLMLFPLGSIFRASLWDETGFSLNRYLEVFTNAAFLKAIWNTVVISFWFGVPAILGLPAGIHTVTTQIWALFQYPPRLDMAAAFSVPLLLATMVLIAVQKKILGRRGFSTVGGKGGQKRLIRFGWGRVPVLLLVLGVLSLSVFLPYWILLKAALSTAWAMPLTWDNFTLKNFSFAFFEYGDTQRAIFNTFKLGILTATIGTLLATLIAYITNRNLFRGARYLSFFALAPLVIPGIVLAVGLFIAYTRPPLVLYGTIWILFVAYLTKEMPIGFSQAESTFKTIHPELEDASRIIGANRLISLKDVTAPLARSGLIAAWSFIFIGVIRELSASILLFAPASKVVSVVIFDLKEEGQVGVISVLGILLLVASFAVILAMQWFAGRDVVATRE